jgi:hypothetical protein
MYQFKNLAREEQQEAGQLQRLDRDHAVAGSSSGWSEVGKRRGWRPEILGVAIGSECMDSMVFYGSNNNKRVTQK